VTEESAGWQAEGRISLATMMTDLLRTDQSIFEPPSFPFDDDFKQMMFWLYASQGAARGNDQTFATNLPPGLSDTTRRKLFHERYHYAQLMTYPLLQLSFVTELEQLRVKVQDREGFPHVLCGQTRFDQVAQDVTYELQSLAAYLSGTAQSGGDSYLVDGVEGVELLNAIFEEGARRFKGSAGRLMFGAESQLVPFTAVNLLESAALVAEHLYHGELPPRMTAPGSELDVRYRGCWELWCRLHARRFDTPRKNAEAFLAAADLALGVHVLAEHDQDIQGKMQNSEFSAQMRLPHARFLALLLCASQVDIPRALEGAAAAAHFQASFCEFMGWPDPQRPYKLMAAFLSQRVLLSSIWSFWNQIGGFDEAAMTWALGADLSEVAADLDRLHPVWKTLARSFFSTPEVGTANVVIGSRIIGKMIDCCLVRINGRFSIAAPHIDPMALSMYFNLPVIRLGNQYYLDSDLSDSPSMMPEAQAMIDLPIRLTGIDIMADCLAIATLRPLLANQTRCGLIDPVTKEPNCVYSAADAGCPQTKLTPEQVERRREEGVHDWCHWTHAALRTGTAPAELRLTWTDRWKAASGTLTNDSGCRDSVSPRGRRLF
jgi:hypothetical protein